MQPPSLIGPSITPEPEPPEDACEKWVDWKISLRWNYNGEGFFNPIKLFQDGATFAERGALWDTIKSTVNLPDYKIILIYQDAKRGLGLINPGRAEWYFEELILPKNFSHEDKDFPTGFTEWFSSLKASNKYSQKFRSKNAAIAALTNGETWFDGNYSNLEAIKKASETGEMIKVKYWGGSRVGKDRNLTVIEVIGFEESKGEEAYWLAEVLEHGDKETKTYRVDRMQLMQLRPIDLVD